MTTGEVQKSIGDFTRLVREMDLKLQEEEQDLVVILFGDKVEIREDDDYDYFVKYHDTNK